MTTGTTSGATSLARLLQGTPYVSYAYASPHKSAYRRLDPPVPLVEAWAAEDPRALILSGNIRRLLKLA